MGTVHVYNDMQKWSHTSKIHFLLRQVALGKLQAEGSFRVRMPRQSSDKQKTFAQETLCVAL